MTVKTTFYLNEIETVKYPVEKWWGGVAEIEASEKLQSLQNFFQPSWSYQKFAADNIFEVCPCFKKPNLT